jgi:hypothetical protein
MVQRMKTWIRIIVVAPLVAATPALGAVTTCGTTCSSDCQLGANLSCQSGETGVTLANGADLDMRGFDIVCPNGCTAAVTMTGTNSRVINTGSDDPNDPEPKITGFYDTGAINCGKKAGSSVLGITVRAFWFSNAGITNCQFVSGSKVIGVPILDSSYPPLDTPIYPTIGIMHTAINASDVISSTFIADVRNGISRVPSTASNALLNIAFDTIDARLTVPGQSIGCAINGLGDQAHGLSIHDDVFAGDSQSAPICVGNATGVAYSNNFCRTHNAACAACIASGQCAGTGTGTSVP